jgi:pseudouridine kinase
MENKSQITIIGAVNIDLIGYPDNDLIYKDDNVGSLETILGGVGRNIAENLARLDVNVNFLTVFAKDHFAKQIKESCKELKIDISQSLEIPNATTSTFMAIMDKHNDMALGISAMHIYDEIPNSFILNNLKTIQENKYCILETNIPQSILELVINKAPNTKFALDAVSGTKALKAKNILPNLHLLKCNLIEAELLSGIKITSEYDYELLVKYFLKIGVEKVFITLGKKGLIYGENSSINRLKPMYEIKPVNTTGGGDSFMAGLLLAELNNFDIHKMAKTATACAELTIQHKKTVHPKINKEHILNQIND